MSRPPTSSPLRYSCGNVGQSDYPCLSTIPEQHVCATHPSLQPLSDLFIRKYAGRCQRLETENPKELETDLLEEAVSDPLLPQ